MCPGASPGFGGVQIIISFQIMTFLDSIGFQKIAEWSLTLKPPSGYASVLQMNV